MGTYREQLLARGGSTIFNAPPAGGGTGLCGIPRGIVRCLYSPAASSARLFRWHVYVHTGCLVIYGVNGGDAGSKRINWKRWNWKIWHERLELSLIRMNGSNEFVRVRFPFLCFDAVREF